MAKPRASSKRLRHMTEAEMDKRHEVAEAIHRDNPSMPMAKKMKIATATAMGKRKKHGRRH